MWGTFTQGPKILKRSRTWLNPKSIHPSHLSQEEVQRQQEGHQDGDGQT